MGRKSFPRGAPSLSRGAALAASLCLLAWLPASADEPKCVPPAAGDEALLSAEQLTQRIDQALEAAWTRDKVLPAPPAEDAEFLRRAHLDIVGKIPSAAEVEEFLADSALDKRTCKIDELLERGAFAQHFANTWRSLMLAGAADNVQSQLNSPQFETWLRLRFALNITYDRLVRELLTAPLEESPQTSTGITMRSFIPSPVAFFQANEQKPEMIAASTARIFLGVQVECAQCHDHPFSHWTRREFWSLAAFFDSPPGLDRSAKPDSANPNAIRIPNTDIVVEPAFLDGSKPDWDTSKDKRDLLSRWITSSDNPFFARAAVNRLWDHFLGRGFVDPVDDLDKANLPSHPELLELMARQFAAHSFDLNYLIRAIANSRAYQLSSRAEKTGDDDLARFARMPVRRMTADQLFASIVEATGYRQPRRTMRQGQIVPDLASAAAEFRNRFADQSVRRTEAETSILQALALMNGRLVSNATDLETSETLVAVAEAPFLSNHQRVEALFLATLSRPPESEELSRLASYVERGGAAQNPKKALADVFWVLLNSTEFALNH
jgi:hypothetical protein